MTAAGLPVARRPARRRPVLGVGAGREATIYWLTRHVGEVVATDLYADRGRLVRERLERRHAHRPRPLLGRRLESRAARPSGTWSASSSSSRTTPSTRSSPRARSSTSATSRTSGAASRRCSACCARAGSSPWRRSSGWRATEIGYPGLLRFDEPELRALLLDGLWWDPATPIDASDLGRDAGHRGRDERGDRRPGVGPARLEPLPAPRPPPRAVPLDQRPRRAGQVRPDRRPSGGGGRRSCRRRSRSREQLDSRRAYPAVAWGRRKLARERS